MTKKYILALLLLSILTIVYAQENQTENLIVTDNALNLSNEAAVDNVSTEIFLNETIGITQNVTNETVIAPAIVCNETQCDNTCVVCSDQNAMLLISNALNLQLLRSFCQLALELELTR